MDPRPSPPVTAAYVAAPLLSLAYGALRIVDGFDGSRGPGFAWTVGHLAFMAALLLFVVVFRDMWALLGRSRGATVTLVIGVAGIGCLFSQFAIDVVVGFLAADHDAMGPMFDAVRAVPGVSPLVYEAGPALFYLAQIVFTAHLAARRQVAAWVPALVIAQVALPFASKDLLPVSAALALVAFLPLALRGRRRPAAVPAHA